MKLFNKIRKREDLRKSGQVIVLGMMGLFIMALAVILTLNIGHAIHEKIKLQNAADAASYSIAAREAQVFNFFAFTNRAQIAHYSLALTLQSYINYLSFVYGSYGIVRDMTWNAATVYYKICETAVDPYLKSLYCALYGVAEAIADGLFTPLVEGVDNLLHRQPILLGYPLDRGVAEIIDGITELNKNALWRAQLQQGLLLNTILLSGGYPFIERNDPNVNFSALNLFNATLNEIEYWKVFDRGGGLNFSLIGVISNLSDIWSPRIHNKDNCDEDVVYARKVMTEMVNGSRWGPSNQSHFVTDRSDYFPFNIFVGVVDIFAFWEHRGQTRLINTQNYNFPIREIRQDSDSSPIYYEGKVIASDDYIPYEITQSFTIIQTPFSRFGSAIWSEVRGSNQQGDVVGVHYGYKKPQESSWSPNNPGIMPPGTIIFSPIGIEEIYCALLSAHREENWPRNISSYDDHNWSHEWKGIVAFPKFNPSPDPSADYNQPSVWIFLNKPPENMERPWTLDFSMRFGDQVIELDTTVGGERQAIFPFLRGVNAISRAQVYYHRVRPGFDGSSNWQEHPNFFNPFWNARLAPISLKLKQLYDDIVSNRLHLDTSNQVIRGGINFLRNALGELFFDLVTSLMTH